MFRTRDVQEHGTGWALDYLKRHLSKDLEVLTFQDLIAKNDAPPFYHVLAFVYEVRKQCDQHNRSYGPTDLTFNAALQVRNSLLLMRNAQNRVVPQRFHSELSTLYSRIDSHAIDVFEGLFRMNELISGRIVLSD